MAIEVSLHEMHVNTAASKKCRPVAPGETVVRDTKFENHTILGTPFFQHFYVEFNYGDEVSDDKTVKILKLD